MALPVVAVAMGPTLRRCRSSTIFTALYLLPVSDTPPVNIYFELTEGFNAHEPTVALASGQAVV